MLLHIRRMLDGGDRHNSKPREKRHGVVLQARMRVDSGWSDACILNLSTRGLLVYSTSGANPGAYVEVRRGQQVIVARVVWRENQRMGLCSQDCLQIEQVVSGSQLPALQLGPKRFPIERRRHRREYEKSRTQARAMEFISIAIIGATLASAAYATVRESLSTPMARVAAALHPR
ncbi:hypothetical protein BH24PSE1_BH24PSE1_06860 [soil metagenome]